MDVITYPCPNFNVLFKEDPWRGELMWEEEINLNLPAVEHKGMPESADWFNKIHDALWYERISINW